MIKSLVAGAAALALACTAAPALAQAESFTPGTVWQMSSIKVLPGQFQNYMDFLSKGTWRKIQELGKKEGYIVSYHVFSVNNSRHDEPDLILAIEYRDYVPNAEQTRIQKKIEAALAMDARGMDAAGGQRQQMREQLGSMELQELNLK